MVLQFCYIEHTHGHGVGQGRAGQSATCLCLHFRTRILACAAPCGLHIIPDRPRATPTRRAQQRKQRLSRNRQWARVNAYKDAQQQQQQQQHHTTKDACPTEGGGKHQQQHQCQQLPAPGPLPPLLINTLARTVVPVLIDILATLMDAAADGAQGNTPATTITSASTNSSTTATSNGSGSNNSTGSASIMMAALRHRVSSMISVKTSAAKVADLDAGTDTGKGAPGREAVGAPGGGLGASGGVGASVHATQSVGEIWQAVYPPLGVWALQQMHKYTIGKVSDLSTSRYALWHV